MHANKLPETAPLGIDDLKTLTGRQRPAITLLMPVFRGGKEIRENPIRLEQTISSIRQQLEALDVPHGEIRDLLEPIQGLADYFHPGSEIPAGNGLAVFRSPDLFQTVWTPETLPEKAVVGGHFYLKPLLPSLTQDRSFYLLALSQKHIRLLLCTDHSSEEVPLPPGTPTDITSFEGTAKPDHVLDNKSAGGPSEGSMKGVMFGTNTDREARDEHIAHFYRAIDHGLEDLLRDSQKPLVIAGVEYEIPIFKRATTYNNLAGAVIGAPDGLKGGELHKRALDAMQEYWEKPVEDALAHFDKLYGVGRATTNTKEVVKAACEGRISHLLAAQNAEVMGEFHEAVHDVSTHKEPAPGEEDLVNLAALWTLRNSGQVYLTSRNKVPKGAPMMALLRY